MFRENGLPVPDDIIYEILLSSPLFSSLKATLLTCKQFYRVFQSHPNSVVRAVAYNITGPALPQALECIRHPFVPVHSRPLLRLSLSDPDDLGDLLSAPIIPSETYQIVANSKIVKRLEDMFSFRYVDRTASTSQLSPSESRVFCIAVYRLMLYGAIANLDAWIHEELNSEEGDRVTLLDNREDTEKGDKLFSRLSTLELLQLHSVAEFLKEVLCFCARNYDYADEICDLVVVAGPGRIFNGFDNKGRDGLRFLDDFSCFFRLEDPETLASLSSSPLLRILDLRNVEPPSGFAHWLSVSSRASERNSQCDRCQETFDFGAHSKSTFTEISNGECYRLHITYQQNYGPQHIHQYLKSNLRCNTSEISAFIERIKEFGASLLLLQMWNDLWRLDLVQQQPEDQQFPYTLPDWTEDSYLCPVCFTSFLSENLWLWWRHIKSSSKTLKQDCCYGFNCELQVKSALHAEDFNHLCEQTQVDNL
ncbi:hypothetical protein EV360DRAFT_80169 [Lentinula raphanica]|nr:hypothetical protein EV360DRAFT_80169 [Lentinula raphanica]